MVFAVDFDNTVVAQDHAYADLESPLNFLPGAREGLLQLKAAGHVLLMWSSRSSRSLLVDPMLDPLARTGARRVDRERWAKSFPVNLARFAQMLEFLERELPGIFSAVDDGAGGKPQVDRFIDDKASEIDWFEIAAIYGDSDRLPIGWEIPQPQGGH